jgi:exodeoxyribonuclease VIII
MVHFDSLTLVDDQRIHNMKDVMLDLETLGKRPGCAILSIGAVFFDAETGTTGEWFYAVINRTSCFKAGLHEDLETLKWWHEQNEEAKKILAETTSGGEQLAGALLRFADYLGDASKVRLWGNGSDFDNAILAHCYSTVANRPPWEFWNNRCYRTLKSLVPSVKMRRTGVHHNALDDAKTQAIHAMEILEHFKGAK